jgi:NitT/TauT family transport system permease protein
MRALSLLSTRSFLGHVASTLVRTIIAAGLGFPAGILVAVGILVLGPARRSGELVLDFLRSIPLTALVPFFIVAYGVGDSAKIAIGAVASGLTAAIAVWVGIRESRSRASLFLYLYRPSIRGILLAILPGALPSVAGALRLAVSYALVLVIVAEMFIGSGSGLGRAIVDFSYTDDRPAQYAAIGVAGALGYVLNALADVVSRYVGRIVQT